jgi:hypothetical protein
MPSPLEPTKPTHVGVGRGGKLAGIQPVVLLRLALVGEIPYQVTPDRRPVFSVTDLEKLRGRLSGSPAVA